MRLQLEHQIKGRKNVYTQSNQGGGQTYRFHYCLQTCALFYLCSGYLYDITAHVPTADHWIQLGHEPSTLIALFYHIQSLGSLLVWKKYDWGEGSFSHSQTPQKSEIPPENKSPPALPSTHLLLVISGVSLQEQPVFHMQRWLTFWISSSPNTLMYFKVEFYQTVRL